MSTLERPAVMRVRDTLSKSLGKDNVIDLGSPARSAKEAASALGCPLGAIVKSLVFCIDSRFVLALVAGDHSCVEANLPKALNIKGVVRRPQASEVKGVTGFTIGGVAPIGLAHALPTAVDASLKRFEIVYAAAGHPNCVFPISVSDLSRLTEGLISHNIAKAIAPEDAYTPKFSRSKTFTKDTPNLS